MHGGNRNLNWLWWVFFAFLFTGGWGILPLVVILGIVLAILTKSLKTNRDDSTGYRARPNLNDYKTYDTSSSKYSAADLAKVNVALRKYFRDHKSLAVLSDIDLRLRGSAYTSLSSLDVYRNGDYVCSLDAFGVRYHEMYEEILGMLVRFSQQDAEVFDAETAETTDTTEQKPQAAEEAPKKTLKTAQEFIDQINSLNNDIPDEGISNGLYQTCSLLTQIQTLQKKLPGSQGKLEKLYQYYLPILVNILQQYSNLQSAGGQNLAKTKEKLTQTIDLINGAMKTIIQSMTDSDFINLSADMSTLSAVLEKDGLAGDHSISDAVAKSSADHTDDIAEALSASRGDDDSKETKAQAHGNE